MGIDVANEFSYRNSGQVKGLALFIYQGGETATNLSGLSHCTANEQISGLAANVPAVTIAR